MGMTCFQEHGDYIDDIAIKSDIVLVYGIDNHFHERVKVWKIKGYKTFFMTGIAWGQFKDYDLGSFDGQNHLHEGQMDKNNDWITHEGNINYMVPTSPYINYMKSIMKKAIDSGVEGIVIEEPEFWIWGGYSQVFKNEYEKYYQEPWNDPHLSYNTAFKCAVVMHHLYTKALNEIFAYIKSINKDIQCIVATHSLLNYSAWHIVSPQFTMNENKYIDGYIGQVWTGTARVRNVYCGIKKERTFENAFLEYGVLHNLVQNNDKKMYFLADPIEDNPNHTWDNYKNNYEATLLASLLYSDVIDFEVMPWPRRIFCTEYPKHDTSSTEKESIPKWYAEEVLRINNTLNDMEQMDVIMDSSHLSLGIVVSNSMMYERLPELNDDPELSDFYGMSLPLVKNGVIVTPISFETSDFENYIKKFKILLMNYNYMKPLNKNYHYILANWVERGGLLLYLGDHSNEYNNINSWWIDEGYISPQHHLFELLGCKYDDGLTNVGDGAVLIKMTNPKEIANKVTGAEEFINLVDDLLSVKNEKVKKQNYLKLNRGPYTITWVFDESSSNEKLKLKGNFIDLLDKDTSIIHEKLIEPNQGSLIYDLDKIDKSVTKVLVSSSRIVNEVEKHNKLTFFSYGPIRTNALTHIYYPNEFTSINVKNSNGQIIDVLSKYNDNMKILTISHPNEPEGVFIEIE